MKQSLSLSTIACLFVSLAVVPAVLASQIPDLAVARKARDQGSIQVLQAEIARAQQEISRKQSFEAYLRLARLQDWLCEAAQSHQDDTLIKQAAEAGVAAADMAVKLNPDSSSAHQLLGDLLGQLIPHVFGGGFRYGRRSTLETDRALQLDANNVDALVTRAVSYFYTPGIFGGSNKRAVDLLRKAVDIDPRADSPHLWLAQIYLSDGRRDDALREVNEARRLNPDRQFAQYVYDQAMAAKK